MKQLILPRIPGIVLFLCIWLVVWCQPTLRSVLLGQLPTNGSIDGPFQSEYHGAVVTFDDLARKYPDDVNIAVSAAQDQGYGASSANSGYTPRIRVYDDVIRRFPNQAWIIALRLVNTMSTFQGDRLGGDFENPKLPPYLTPSPEKSPKPPNFTPAQLQASIDLAYQGRQLEPDNCFFDWVLARLLMDGYRDEQAFRVMHEAARKPRYDDHLYDGLAAEIAAQERLGPVRIERKVVLMSSILFPHFSRLRSLAHLIAWQAYKAGKSGDHNKSILIGDDMAHLCIPLMRGRNSIIAGLVGESIQAIAWNRTPPALGTFAARPATVLACAQKFATYAGAHGHPAIAAETLRVGNQTTVFANAVRKTPWTLDLAAPSLLPTETFWWLCLAALFQTLALIVLASILAVILFATRPTPIQLGDLCASVGAAAVVLALSAYGCVRLGLGQYAETLLFGAGNLPKHIGLLASCFCAFALAPIVVGALVCWSVTLFRMWRSREEPSDPPEPQYYSPSEGLLSPDMRPMVLGLMKMTYAAATIGSVCAAAVALQGGAASWNVPIPIPGASTVTVDSPAPVFACLAAVLIASGLLGWVIQWRWISSDRQKPYTHYAMRWYRQTLSIFILISSLAYAIAAYGSLPYRRAADREFARYLQQGEEAVLGFPEVR